MASSRATPDPLRAALLGLNRVYRNGKVTMDAAAFDWLTLSDTDPLDVELLARAITATFGYTEAEMDEQDEEGKTVIDYHVEWWETPRQMAIDIADQHARLGA